MEPIYVTRLFTLNGRKDTEKASECVRNWIVDHMGTYRDQARQALKGGGHYQRDAFTLAQYRSLNVMKESFQVATVVYDNDAEELQYVMQVLTMRRDDPQQYGHAGVVHVAGYMGMGFDPEVVLPEKAQMKVLDEGLRVLASPTVDAVKAASGSPQELPAITCVSDIFSAPYVVNNGHCILVTPMGCGDEDLMQSLSRHGSWSPIMHLSNDELVAVAQGLSDEDAGRLVRSKAFLLRHARGGPTWVSALVGIDGSMDDFDASRRNHQRMLLGESHLMVLNLLQSTLSVSHALSKQAGGDTENLIADLKQTNIRLQSRVDTLSDQLAEAKSSSQRSAQSISLRQSTPETVADATDDGNENPDAETASSGRYETVLDAVTDPGRFPNLRFFDNAMSELSGYRRQIPQGDDIVAALDKIEQLAKAYMNTPNGKIGPWERYFETLAGWKYAFDESKATQGQYRREFMDQLDGGKIVITRHLTCVKSGASFQIFFDMLPERNEFVVSYLGPHLPYVSKTS